jgi:hypothetical protein
VEVWAPPAGERLGVTDMRNLGRADGDAAAMLRILPIDVVAEAACGGCGTLAGGGTLQHAVVQGGVVVQRDVGALR